MAGQSSVQSIERGFSIIELLCKNGELGITEISEMVGLHKTTVFRLLSTICSLGYAEKDPVTKNYKLTLKFLKMSSNLLAKIDVRDYVRTFLEQIPTVTGETVHLVERSGDEIIYIDKFDSTQNSIRMVSRIGLSLPMIYTAVGKAILSHCSNNEIEKVWNSTGIIKKTCNTITDFQTFLKEIEQVRKNGYAIDNEENELGVCCIAAAIPDIYGEYNHAFSVSAPVSRMSSDKMKEYANLVLKTRDEIVFYCK